MILSIYEAQSCFLAVVQVGDSWQFRIVALYPGMARRIAKSVWGIEETNAQKQSCVFLFRG